MTFPDYLRILRERWIVLVVAVALAMTAAATYAFLRPEKYTAKLTMYVSSQGADNTTAAFQGAQLSQDRVASYTELLTSPRVTTDVIKQLHLPWKPSELAARMTATSKLDSVLLDLAVTDTDPQRATDIANAAGQVFPALVAELEKPTNPGSTPAVAVRVVQPASVPDEPSSTDLSVMLALGLLAGLALGIAGALARNAVDASVNSPDQLHAAAGAPNLGMLAFDTEVAKKPLAAWSDPHSPRSEALRQLRTNLQFIDVENPHKVILVTSAVPGEGKTATSSDLATVLASAGSRVLLVEADLRRPKIAERLGLDGAVGLTSVLSGRVALTRAIQSWDGGAIDVLASGPLPPNPSELLGGRQMREMLDHLRITYDIVLIDSPPLLPVTDAAAIAPSTDGAIMVCHYRRTTQAQVRSAAKALAAVSAPLLGTVLTMVPASGPNAYAGYRGYYSVTPPAGCPTEQPHAPSEPRMIESRNGHVERPDQVASGWFATMDLR